MRARVVAIVAVAVQVARADAAPPPCAAIADRIIAVLAGESDARTRALVAQRPKLRAMLAHRCEIDEWSDDARDCFYDVRYANEVTGCRSELDSERQDRLDDGVRAVETPSKTGVAIVGTLVELETSIAFDGETARLSRGGKLALDKLARELAARPDLTRLVVGVHNVNADRIAMIDRAQERANAIRDYLIAAGVDAMRVAARSIERTQPGVELRVDRARPAPPPIAVPADVAAPPPDASRTANGAFVKILVPGGSRRHPTADDSVRVHYTGWTTDGKQFDSSITRGAPATFSLRAVIAGWTEGIPLLAVGDTARLWIPEELAYKGSPGRPQGMLVFDVELLAIETSRSAGRVREPVAADLAAYVQKLGGRGARLVATIATTAGTLHCELLPKRAPVAVASFVGLATGGQPWRDPNLREVRRGKPFYDGLAFHRVIPDFMIQGGDPLGDGTGGPGYKFRDETAADDEMTPGALAMANEGPDTNGSQFFIVEAASPHLVGRHTVFGRCAELDVVTAIAHVPRDDRDRPTTAVTIRRVTIERRP